MPVSAKALQGIKVVEMGDHVSAPFCARLLADLGADVLKVEPPGHGDSSRRNGPFPQAGPGAEASGLFLICVARDRHGLRHDVSHLLVDGVRDELAVGEVADRAVPFVHDEDAARLPGLLPFDLDELDRVADAQVGRHGDELAVHDPASGLRVVARELPESRRALEVDAP